MDDAVMVVYNATEEKVYSDRWGEPEFEAYLSRYSHVTEMEEYKQIREALQRCRR